MHLAMVGAGLMHGGVGWRVKLRFQHVEFMKEEKSSFLKKRTKKPVLFWCARCGTARLKEQKFFVSFFQKRNSCFCFLTRPAERSDTATF
jgi:hypothetical protein